MLGGGGTEIGRKVIYACTNADPDIKDYALTVDNIVIEDNTVIDWGPVKEEINQR